MRGPTRCLPARFLPARRFAPAGLGRPGAFLHFGRNSAARRAYSAAVARITRSSIAATAARAQVR